MHGTPRIQEVSEVMFKCNANQHATLSHSQNSRFNTIGSLVFMAGNFLETHCGRFIKIVWQGDPLEFVCPFDSSVTPMGQVLGSRVWSAKDMHQSHGSSFRKTTASQDATILASVHWESVGEAHLNARTRPYVLGHSSCIMFHSTGHVSWCLLFISHALKP